MSEPSKKQLELEQSIFSISGYNKISKNNKLREQGRESETYYARNMIEAGLVYFIFLIPVSIVVMLITFLLAWMGKALFLNN